MQLGRYFLERLTQQAALMRDGKKIDQARVAKKFVEFPPL